MHTYAAAANKCVQDDYSRCHLQHIIPVEPVVAEHRCATAAWRCSASSASQSRPGSQARGLLKTQRTTSVTPSPPTVSHAVSYPPFIPFFSQYLRVGYCVYIYIVALALRLYLHRGCRHRHHSTLCCLRGHTFHITWILDTYACANVHDHLTWSQRQAHISSLTRVRAVVFHAAVFTYGDRGTNVVAVFAAISAAVHIAELNRKDD